MKIMVWVAAVACVVGCSSSSNDGGGAGGSGATAGTGGSAGTAVDITDAIFVERDADCAAYTNAYDSSVIDVQRDRLFDGEVTITNDGDSCTLASNNIPNHDFNDPTAAFATDVAAVNQSLTVPRMPSVASEPTALSQQAYNGVMLNGVPIDILSAGCYDPDSPMADMNGDVPIGCSVDDPWLLDPLGTEFKFGADANNAHTQPDGSYHYHGNPNAMFDDMPGPEGSPVIGFAADGFPIYGSYFLYPDMNTVRAAVSGYTLRAGDRPDSDGNPGGPYDGRYVDDWEFTDAGDLDECNGMEVDGQYGYYVIDTFPWILRCLSGTPDPSFQKGMGGP